MDKVCGLIGELTEVLGTLAMIYGGLTFVVAGFVMVDPVMSVAGAGCMASAKYLSK